MAPTPTKQPKKTNIQNPHPIQNSGQDWINNINNFKLHFGRFFWDAVSIILFAFGFLVLLGILGLSKGSVLSSLIEVISTWLGWGSFLIVIMAVAGGIYAFRQGRSTLQLKWKKVISIEHNKEWHQIVNKVKPKNVELILTESDSIDDYLKYFNQLNDKVDIVVIDGLYRNECMIKSFEKLSELSFLVSYLLLYFP